MEFLGRKKLQIESFFVLSSVAHKMLVVGYLRRDKWNAIGRMTTITKNTYLYAPQPHSQNVNALKTFSIICIVTRVCNIVWTMECRYTLYERDEKTFFE